MQYREYKNQDTHSIISLIKSAWDERDIYDGVDYQLIDPFWYEDNIFHNPEYITIVAVDQTGTVRGYITGRVNNSDITIKMLLIERGYRQQGYGRALKRLIVTKAQMLGKEKVITFNRLDNAGSYKLNDSEGWRITKVSDDYYKSEYIFSHKTINEWEEELGIKILDPDGFDRSDPHLYKRRFSKEEFQTKAQWCTIIELINNQTQGEKR